MKIKKGFVLREVAGEYVVVPVGEMSKQFHGMITLNVTGARLWQIFQQDVSKEDAVNLLTSEYEVSQQVALADVEKFLGVLEKNGFLGV